MFERLLREDVVAAMVNAFFNELLKLNSILYLSLVYQYSSSAYRENDVLIDRLHQCNLHDMVLVHYYLNIRLPEHLKKYSSRNRREKIFGETCGMWEMSSFLILR